MSVYDNDAWTPGHGNAIKLQGAMLANLGRERKKNWYQPRLGGKKALMKKHAFQSITMCVCVGCTSGTIQINN